MKPSLQYFAGAMTCVIILFFCQKTDAQTSQSPPTKELEKSTMDWRNEIKSKVTPYGSIRIGMGVTGGGEIGIGNKISFIGLKLKHTLSKNEPDNFSIIGGIEFGLKLINRDETIEFSTDPGGGVTQVGDAVYTRLGFLGVSYKSFEFTIGKQNSVYYVLGASETATRFLSFGGAAVGVWNAKSDGGISGTGRANQVLKLVYKKNGLRLGVQTQTRNITPNSRSFDTYGLGINYQISGFGLGLGYNKVKDGISNPLRDQSKSNDEAIIGSLSYDIDRFLIAVSYAILKQHQYITIAGTNTFYDAKGIELYAKYKFSSNNRWHIAAGFNYLNPDKGQDLQDYDTKFGIIEVGYNYKKSSYIYVTSKIEQSENFSGAQTKQNIYGLGIRFGF